MTQIEQLKAAHAGIKSQLKMINDSLCELKARYTQQENIYLEFKKKFEQVDRQLALKTKVTIITKVSKTTQNPSVPSTEQAIAQMEKMEKVELVRLLQEAGLI